MRIIPRKDIKHLEWAQGQKKPSIPPTAPRSPTGQEVNTDTVLGGQIFYDTSLPTALEKALDFSDSDDGIVATVPELVAAKARVDKTHEFWKNWYTAHTEENIGIDKDGRFYSANTPVLVVVHGGGILTPERIKQAYKGGLLSGSAKYRDEEFEALLDGTLPSGESLTLYTVDTLKRDSSSLPHRFSVVMPYETAQRTKSDYHTKREFLENPLIIARVGGVENLETYFDKAKDSDGKVRNEHPFSGRDATHAQGRLLFLDNYSDGLIGGSLYYDGRFVGVAPEARSAPKKITGN